MVPGYGPKDSAKPWRTSPQMVKKRMMEKVPSPFSSSRSVACLPSDAMNALRHDSSNDDDWDDNADVNNTDVNWPHRARDSKDPKE